MEEGVIMIKKILKLSIISLFLILGFITIDKVNAETYTGQALWPSEFISNIYIKRKESSRRFKIIL